MTAQTPEGTLGAFSHGEHPIFAQLAQMNVDTLPNSELDARTYHIARLAALIAMDAAPASYFANLAVAREAGLTVQDAQGVCVAIAPIVGSSRVVDAAGNVLRAFGLADLAAEYVREEDLTEEGMEEGPVGRPVEGAGEGAAGGPAAGGAAAGGAAAGGAAGAGTATAIPGQRGEGAVTEPEEGRLGESRLGEEKIEEGRREESRIEQGGPAGGGAATYEESREERFVGAPEGEQGASGVTGAREATEGRVEEGAATGEGEKDETIEEKLRGKVSGWMKRDQ
ncbi:carboxymuconolactone decarboxylase family protein [Actinopolymorpha singaporensis]|uniref:Carboxymuconolactone decarboxylase family protein n=1 Tax=Actinopolymorpha singaporensis TaxID=117157 RepID=A0A1H1M516_9ACTN|nr:carboxymuconolactone decarboxylase family protein [Actinopolymorpha singaporensis]SDR81129.1 Carboxymuconolactone decarboxylase family protein [Actinopolymorpha singaporensis]